MTKTLPVFFGLLTFICCQAAWSAGKVYKWTDDKGQVHYSEHPPANTHTDIIKPQTGHSDPVSYSLSSSSTAKVDAKPSTANNKTSQKNPEMCDTARKNLDTLKNHVRVRIPGENGDYRYLSIDEKQQQQEQALKDIDTFCE